MLCGQSGRLSYDPRNLGYRKKHIIGGTSAYRAKIYACDSELHFAWTTPHQCRRRTQYIEKRRDRTCTDIGAHQEHTLRSDSDALDSAVDSGLQLFLNLGNSVNIYTNNPQASTNYRNMQKKYVSNHSINLKVHI